MASIEDLRREIAKEKSWQENELEMQKLGKEKSQLTKELRNLRFQRKYGKSIETVKPIISGAKNTIQRLRSEVSKLTEEQNKRDRINKSIRKKGFQPNLSERRSLFG
jgi:predicted RNase H-like nuclease (RuvC/YqgF family)